MPPRNPQDAPADDPQQDSGATEPANESQVPAQDGGPASTSAESTAPGPGGTPGGDEVSFRDLAQEHGFDVSGYSDDESAVRAMAQQAQVNQQQAQMAQYGQQYVQHAADFQQYLQQKAEAAQVSAPEPEVPQFWNPPAFNAAWLNMVDRDPVTGGLKPVNGGTLETVQQVQRYLQHRSEEQDSFWSQGPQAYMDPYINHRLAEERKQTLEEVRSLMAGDRQNQDARNFLDRNSEWMFEKDQAGTVTIDPTTQRPRLTADGMKFAQYVAEADEMGVPQARQHRYAERLLEADRGSRQSGKQQQQANSDRQKQEFLENAAGFAPNQGASTNPSPDGTGQTPPQNENLSLEQQLFAQLEKAGITDEDVRGY